MNNPFEFGRELGTDELVDRVEEVAAVIQTIQTGGKLFLIGPRRFGKTSILKAAQDRMTTSNAVVLRFDAESYPSLERLVTELIAAAAKALKGPVERTGELIRTLFSRLRPELTFNITQDSWSAKLGVNVAATGEAHLSLLVDALQGLEELAALQPKSRPVGLVIDEFQRVIELGGSQAESQLRAAIQKHKRVGYVFAGSKTRMLTAMTMDATRPFYRLGAVRFIGPVPAADFEAFLAEKFWESRFTVEDPTVFRLILSLAENVPYNIQLLAHACWNQMREITGSRRRVLDAAKVHETLGRLVRQYDPFYTQLWRDLTPLQQKTLIAVIMEDGLHLQSQKVARFVGSGSSTLQRTVGALLERGILREQELEGAVQMRFEDPFFSQWIRVFAAGADASSIE